MNSMNIAGILSSFALLLSGSAGFAAPIELVSKPFQSRPSTFGDSGDLELSNDGKWAVFTSNGSGITTNLTGEFILNVFLKNLETGELTLLSQSSALSHDGGNGHSFAATLSSDGQFVVFETEADNLIDADGNESSDVVLYNRGTGTLSLLSGTTNGVAAGSSGAAAITPNGRFILFESDASDFSPLDTNDWVDLYLLNRESGEIQLVTVNSTSTASAATSVPQFALGTYSATASSDGRYVAFISGATNHVPGVTSQSGLQLYLRDMAGGTNIWLSRNTNAPAPTFVSSPVVSSNGAIVAFLSANLEATASATGDGFLYIYNTGLNTRRFVRDASGVKSIVNEFSITANGGFVAFSSSNQVYLHNISSSTTRLVSATTAGAAASGVSSSPQISDDGRYVIFSSTATNLVSGGLTDVFQTYRFDAQTGEIVLLSPATVGPGGADSDTIFPVVSADGSVAGFASYASNLVTNDNPGVNDVFLVSTSGTNAVTLLSTAHPSAISSTPAGGSLIEGQALSADGRRIVFTSIAENIVTNDANGTRDIFLADLQTGTTRLVSVGTSGEPLLGPSSVIGLSLDGNVIAFTSSNVINQTSARSIFVHNAGSGTSKIGNILSTGETSLTVGDAALSADGHYLAFRAATQGAISVRDLEAETTKVVAPPQLTSPALILGFSPGGKYIVARGLGSSYSLIDWRSNRVALTISSSLGYLSNAFSADDSRFLAAVRLTSPSDVLHLYNLDVGTNATLVATNISTAAISADGSTIAYQSRPTALPNDFNLFTYDVSSGTNSPMQIDGTNAVFRIRGQMSLSADGRFVAFATTAALPGAPVVGDFLDIFIYDRVLKTTTLASERLNPAERFGGAGGPLLSADGRALAFDSSAADLVANDRNFGGDIFFRRLAMTDSDSDGLEDGWEQLQFGSLNATADADADSDGVSNREEFRAGTDPNSAASKFVVTTDANGEEATLVLSTPASTGRVYQLQHRANLAAGEWQDVGSPQVAFSDEVAFEVPVNLQGNGFFRIEALE